MISRDCSPSEGYSERASSAIKPNEVKHVGP